MLPRLDQLLLAFLTKDELRAFLQFYNPDLIHHVPWDRAYAPAVFELIDMLTRTDAIRDPKLYSGLAASCPKARTELTLIASHYGLRDIQWPEPSKTDMGHRIAATPRISTIPQELGPLIGRDALVARIAAHLGDETTSTALVLTGASGTGKSELACHVARTQRDAFTHTLYVRFGQGGLPENLATIGLSILGLPIATLSPEAKCDATLLALASQRCLLVYDNVSGPDELQRWLPPHGCLCRVLVSSTWKTWTGRWQSMDIPPLADAAAAELIAALVARHRPAVRDRICQEFAPALIRHAGGLPIQLVPETLALAMKLDDDLGAEYTPTLAPAAEQAFERPWTALSELSRTVLRIAATFKHDQIPPRHLQDLCAIAGIDGGDFDSGLDGCRLLRLAERASNMAHLRIHPRVYDFVRKRAPAPPTALDAVARWFVAAADAVRQAPADDQRVQSLRNYPLDRASWPTPFPIVQDPSAPLIISEALSEIGEHVHAHAWAEYSVASTTATGSDLGMLFLQFGKCKHRLKHFEPARQLFRRAAAAFRSQDGDPARYFLVHKALCWIGRSLYSMGHHHEAMETFQQSADIAVKTPQNDTSLSTSYHYIALCHADLQNYTTAIGFYRRAVSHRERVQLRGHGDLSVDHDNLGSHYNGLGHCHSQLKQYEQAEDCYEKAIAAKNQGDHFGRINHHDQRLNYAGLARCHYRTHRLESAIQLFDQAIQEWFRAAPPIRSDKSELAHLYFSLGRCYRELKTAGRDLESATVMHASAVATYEDDENPEGLKHPSYAVSLHHLGLCHADQQDFVRALRFFERANKHMTSSPGTELANLRNNYFSIGICQQHLGRHKEARRSFARAKAINP